MTMSFAAPTPAFPIRPVPASAFTAHTLPAGEAAPKQVTVSPAPVRAVWRRSEFGRYGSAGSGRVRPGGRRTGAGMVRWDGRR